MFTKHALQNGSPFFYAQSRAYLAAQKGDKYDRWFETKRITFLDLFMNVSVPGALAPDVIMSDYSTNCYDVDFCSLDFKKDLVIPHEIGLIFESRMVAFTESGRSLTDEELKYLHEKSEKSMCCSAQSIGALCIEMNVNGERSIWYDDESCYELSKMTPEEIAKSTTESQLLRELRKCGVDFSSLESLLGSEIPSW